MTAADAMTPKKVLHQLVTLADAMTPMKVLHQPVTLADAMSPLKVLYQLVTLAFISVFLNKDVVKKCVCLFSIKKDKSLLIEDNLV